MKYLWILVVLFVCTAMLRAQEGEYPHPELEWNTIETEHFLIHFHRGAERTAAEVARIAEAIYEPITSLYQHWPDHRTSIVLRDHDDYSNGAAYFFDNRIEIWAPSLDFEFRGTHPWLLNVVTHEFTHIVQIQTAMKFGRRVPALYVQWLGYEAERRPDVLYGFPNVIVSYPLSGFLVPSWFAEGTAQYNHPDLKHDYWDSHRDMILRTAMLDDRMLSWEEMAVFGKTSLGNEQSYNAGFSIVQYIAETYGVEQLVAISKRLSSLPRTTIDGAISEVLGKSGAELYEEWKQAKLKLYQATLQRIASARVEGELLENEGFGNFYPAFSPDGSTLAYVSNRERDYLSLSSIYLLDLTTRERKKLLSGVRSALSFSPDGRYLYYSKLTRKNPFGSRLSDLFRLDLKEEEEERLTYGARAFNPAVSPDGTRIAFVFGSDGTLNLGLSDSAGRTVVSLTQFGNGEQVFTPAWSPDGKRIAFGFSTGHGQRIGIIDVGTRRLEILPGETDARNPCFSPDGRRLLYSEDVGGIFNIFELDLESRQTRQITNVLGGAFLPTVSRKGDVAFVLYTSGGYKISWIPAARQAHDGAGQDHRRTLAFVERDARSDAVANVEGLILRPYRNVYTTLTLIPVVRVDNYNPKNRGLDVLKTGLYFSSYDMVDKLSLFGGAAVNRRLERDLFFVFEYKDRLPLLYQLGLSPILSVELYNLTRRTRSSFELTPQIVSTDITYNLFEVNLSLRHTVIDERNDLRLTYTLSRYGADIGSFINPNTLTLNPGFRNRYFIGNSVTLTARHDGLIPSVDREINPAGRTVLMRYAYEFNKFNVDGDFEIRDGLLVPLYTQFTFQRIELFWSEHVALPLDRHTLTVAVRRAMIPGRRVDSFFDFYVGGFTGMKGYPFYALGGNDVAWLHLTYRFPLWTAINTRILQFYFTKLYGSLFGDVGNAWTGRTPPFGQWKKDAGFELRLEAFSFYAFPTRFFFAGAYGFDRFTRVINNSAVTYGKEWRFYLGVLFGFELGQLSTIRFPGVIYDH